MGAKVVITGHNAKRLQETFELLEGEGHQQIIADLNQEDGIEHIVAECPIMDGLVNNAGRGKSKPVNFLKKEDLQDVYQTNLFGVALLTKGLLKKKKTGGYFVVDRRAQICVYRAAISSEERPVISAISAMG